MARDVPPLRDHHRMSSRGSTWLRCFVLGALVLSFSGCYADEESNPAPQTAPRAVETPSASAKPTPEQEPEPEAEATPKAQSASPLPAPGSKLPTGGKQLAALLDGVHARLRADIDRWLEAGAPERGPLAKAVKLQALQEQRIYRELSGRAAVTERVRKLVRPPVKQAIRANVAASQQLSTLVTPLEPPIKIPTIAPEHPLALKRYYLKAQRQFDIPWQLLASVNFVESRFGRMTGPSSAGALGPMQFIPSTWDFYGNGGDVFDPHDSIMGAARYLSASGAPSDTRAALFAYNRSYAYVDAIQFYAEQIERDPRNLFAYYFWQVFVKTTRGDLQLTGPGSPRYERD